MNPLTFIAVLELINKVIALGGEIVPVALRAYAAIKKESGLTLPHTYKINLSVDSPNGSFLADWTIILTQFSFNQPIDPTSFNTSSK